jgi:UDP-N-acetylglucosamine--N-acetylmuramyl-(pentapeptide) pyrophosphoryl-undecaprenol N-acetylglucosamine transferase
MAERLRFASQLVASWRRARRLLRSHPAAVAVGFGSYVSVPPLLAARSGGARLILHEQNVEAGAANRLLAPLAGAIATAVEPTRGFGKRRKLRLVGNPIRAEVLKAADRAEARRYFRLGSQGLICLCVGGSQGALGLNRLLLQLLQRTAEMNGPASAWQLLWSTGPAHFEMVMREMAAMGLDPHEHGINPYIDEMARAYAAADLVIARAGALTLAELTAWGRPAILVPLPRAGRGHQKANAGWLADAGAAVVVDQQAPDAVEQLKQVLGQLASSPEKKNKMAEASRRLGRPDAARQLGRLVLELMPNP